MQRPDQSNYGHRRLVTYRPATYSEYQLRFRWHDSTPSFKSAILVDIFNASTSTRYNVEASAFALLGIVRLAFRSAGYVVGGALGMLRGTFARICGEKNSFIPSLKTGAAIGIRSGNYFSRHATGIVATLIGFVAGIVGGIVTTAYIALRHPIYFAQDVRAYVQNSTASIHIHYAHTKDRYEQQYAQQSVTQSQQTFIRSPAGMRLPDATRPVTFIRNAQAARGSQPEQTDDLSTNAALNLPDSVVAEKSGLNQNSSALSNRPS